MKCDPLDHRMIGKSSKKFRNNFKEILKTEIWVAILKKSTTDVASAFWVSDLVRDSATPQQALRVYSGCQQHSYAFPYWNWYPSVPPHHSNWLLRKRKYTESIVFAAFLATHVVAAITCSHHSGQIIMSSSLSSNFPLHSCGRQGLVTFKPHCKP